MLVFPNANFVNLFEITKEYNIVELVVPAKMIGRTVMNINFNKIYNVIVLTKLKLVSEINKLGVSRTIIKAGEIVTANTRIEENDILVVYGHRDDIKRMLRENE